MQHVATASDVEAAIEGQQSPTAVLLQFGKHDCGLCVPFTEAVEALKADFAFHHLMVTATDAPELVEYYGVCMLPAFVVLGPGERMDSGELVQRASPEQIRVKVRSVCVQKLRLDEDF